MKLQSLQQELQALIQEFRKGGGWTRGGKRGWVREGDVPPPARSAEVFFLAVDILCMKKCFLQDRCTHRIRFFTEFILPSCFPTKIIAEVQVLIGLFQVQLGK